MRFLYSLSLGNSGVRRFRSSEKVVFPMTVRSTDTCFALTMSTVRTFPVARRDLDVKLLHYRLVSWPRHDWHTFLSV